MKTQFRSLILSSLLTICVASPSLADNVGSPATQKNLGSSASSPKITGPVHTSNGVAGTNAGPAGHGATAAGHGATAARRNLGETGTSAPSAAAGGSVKPGAGTPAFASQPTRSPSGPLKGQIQRHVKGKVSTASAVSTPNALEQKLLSEPYDPSAPPKPFHEPPSNDPDAPINNAIHPVSSNAR